MLQSSSGRVLPGPWGGLPGPGGLPSPGAGFSLVQGVGGCSPWSGGVLGGRGGSPWSGGGGGSLETPL